jgi:hypothetical protein
MLALSHCNSPLAMVGGRMLAALTRSRMAAWLGVTFGVAACASARSGVMHDIEHIGVHIARPPAEVYE